MELHLIKDFPEKSMLKLKIKLLDLLFNNAISVLGSKKELALKLNISWHTLYGYKKRLKFIPFKIVQKILDICNLEYSYIEGNIKEVRFRYTASFEVLNQKLTVNFRTKSGIKIVAALAGDGYLGTFGNIGYVNKNQKLRKEFLKNLQNTFSCIKLPDYSKAYSGKDLKLSRFFGYIFERTGIPRGKKVFTNSGTPEWILNYTNNELVALYLQQLFDDEGHVSSVEKKMIDLPQSVDITKEKRMPKLLNDMKFLLEKIGIKSNIPYPVRYYEVKEKDKVYNRVKYVLTISNYSELKNFRDKVGFLSKHKQKRLNKIVSTPTLSQRKNKEIEKDSLEACKKIQSQNKMINDLLLANELNIGKTYAQQLLRRLAGENKVVKIVNKRTLRRVDGKILSISKPEFKLKGSD